MRLSPVACDEVWCSVQPRPKFADILAADFVARIVQKRPIGRKFVRLPPLLYVCAGVFEIGATVGRSFCECAEYFAIPFFIRDDAIAQSGQATDWMRSLGREAADAAPQATTTEELYFAWEMTKQGVQFTSTGWPLWVSSLADKRVSPDYAVTHATVSAVCGAGFGIEFPERFKEIYPASFTIKQPSLWHEAFEQGLVDSPEEPKRIPMEEFEHTYRSTFAEFCTDFYPELVSPLGLQ